MSRRGWNASLIGKAGSVAMLQTPALVLELDLFERNIDAMIRLARGGGCRLRPHMKGPKSTRVAQALIEAGVQGLACATAFEAEIFANAGFRDLLLTTPIGSQPTMQRMIALARQTVVTVVVDDAASVRTLSQLAKQAGIELSVLVDIDVGQCRTGVTGRDDLVELAELVEDLPALGFLGVQAYYGHLQGVVTYSARRDRANEQLQRLSEMIDALREADLPPSVVTGGGTGTAMIDASSGIFTELQPGSFPFVDVAYENVDLAGDGSPLFSPSLLVHSTVVSANQSDRVTIDAGMKAIPTDGPRARVVSGAADGTLYEIAGDEFGFLLANKESDILPSRGERVVLVPPHCDTALNLHSFLHVVRSDTLVDLWEIEARGQW